MGRGLSLISVLEHERRAFSPLSWAWWDMSTSASLPTFPPYFDFPLQMYRWILLLLEFIITLCSFLPLPKLGITSPRIHTCLNFLYASRPSWSPTHSKETKTTSPFHTNLFLVWAPIGPWPGGVGGRLDRKGGQVGGRVSTVLDTCSHSSWHENGFSWWSRGKTLLSNVKLCQVLGRYILQRRKFCPPPY